ncbi:YggS family pyridoxal phosphate-dependent enzyme [Parendozoicomonas haliclonae]|uniref:Pyridoxal phosphate homeostasis protein n=1 Tax=Parendozoicomonas haliclonae TaxID=1960125 RepID=A0A1X7AJR7_9GAMM|nr:YggS family pyridoxal phosphate-dependent enzyme [Parendozoicomonas haliclonae]SMA46157.1 hypothetical protein EHSB41UT_02087 [Parendozoicomonas haliclonae]
MTSIETRLQQTRDSINEARERFGRTDAVQLLAVSKTKPAEQVREAYQYGQRAFGENYVQEGVDKVKTLADLEGIEWHFIGPIQSNKTRPVAESFDWVHSVDRLKIASRLSEQRPADLPPLNICLQVNIDNEASKSGFTPEQVLEVAEQVIALPNIVLRGLMAIPAPSETEEEQRKPLRAMSELLHELQKRFPELPLDTLSMGMSDDMAAAIAEGATIVRVGTAIFGAR